MHQGHSRWKRTALIWIAGLLLLCLCLWGAWQLTLRYFAIEQLSWQGLRYQQGQWQLQTLTLHRSTPTQQLHIQAQNLSFNAPQQALRIEQLQLSYQPTEPAVQEAITLALPADLRQWLPNVLPKRIELQQMTLLLPCTLGQCQLQGRAQLLRPNSDLAQLYLGLQHEEHQLRLEANLYGDQSAPEMIATLLLDENPRASFRHSVKDGLWQGQLTLAQLPEATWLLPWIEQWSGPQPHLQQVPEAHLDFRWKLSHPPTSIDLDLLPKLKGEIQAQIDLSQAWPVPNIGLLQGQAQLSLDSHSGVWQARTLSADLKLEPLPTLQQALPEGLRPKQLALQITPLGSSQSDNVLPLSLQLQITGALRAELQAQALLVADLQQPSLSLQQAHLTADSAALQWGAWTTKKTHAELTFSAQLNMQQLTLQLEKGSQLSAAQIVFDEMGAEQVALSSDNLQFQLRWPAAQALDYQLSGTALLSSQKIKQAQLRAQTWRWPATVKLTPQQLHVSGSISNQSDFTLPITLTSNASGLTLEAQASSWNMTPNNPLQATLSAWPALLETQQGQLMLKAARYRIPHQGAATLNAQLHLSALSGIYDRSEFTQLSGPLNLDLQQDALKISTPALQLKHLNSGIGIGPFELAGHYAAPVQKLANGRVQWQTARAEALGGKLWIAPSQLQLGQANTARTLHIQGLEIEQLLKAYPAEGLHGEGSIDGQLPVKLSAQGFSIAQGELKARAPGGRLQFQSAKLNALGQNNAAMKMVVEALHDFHYQTLSSAVNFSEQGKLQLALRLEGSNPTLENGRPIHFNVNLEEDIPALLTSLQLSNKVSERIQKRVQQRINQNGSTP